MSPEAPEGDRPFYGGHQRLFAVRCLQRQQLVEVAPQRGDPRGGRSLDEGLGRGTESTEGLLRDSLRAHRAPRCRPRSPVVGVFDRGLPGSDDGVAGHDLTEVENLEVAAFDQEPKRGADEVDRDRVAGRAEADTAQPVDLSLHELSHLRAKRRELA